MREQIKHQMGHGAVCRNAIVACFGALLLLLSGAVQAASLGQIEVASSLGEALYAEVPLKLESNELASKVFIEIASSSDYKIFEVYRDPALDSIRADVASDERGARVKLSSRVSMQTPFFNLVLKIRYGRVSHFKKYAVFLDTEKAVQRVVEMQPLAHVEATTPVVDGADTTANASKLTESAGQVVTSNQDLLAARQAFEAQQASPKDFEGWARTEKYGPIVRGDSLSIVAQRLRVDGRYSINQVMVALFEKNTASFDRDNMNLIKAEVFLQVPNQEEVEKYSRSEAYDMSKQHEQAWKQRSRYAVEAEVQRTRYSNRVRMGEQADGEAISNIVMPAQTTLDVPEPVESASSVIERHVFETDEKQIPPHIEKLIQAQTETNQLLMALQEKNEALQKQLIANKNSVDVLNDKVDESVAAASNARFEKLELLLTRLQAQLDIRADTQASSSDNTLDWVTWLLLTVLIAVLGVIVMLMRREPVHPSVEQAPSVAADPDPASASASQAADAKTSSPVPAAESLEDVVEGEVDNIETDEKEVSLAKATGSFDAMSSFNDELSDTDTAELEPFDVNATQVLDPNVDYLSEADVYIRYGMEEEALQQLDMALRVNSDNSEAHIKKAELLHAKQDKPAFATAVALATSILAVSELERYNAAIEAFGGTVDVLVDEPEGAVDTSPVTMAIDDVDMDDLDFDLTGLDIGATDSGIEVADIGLVSDVSDQVEPEKVESAESEADEVESVDELDWLSDPAFAIAAEPQDDIEIQFDALPQSDMVIDSDMAEQTDPVAAELQTKSGATQQLGSLLGEFSGEETIPMQMNEDTHAEEIDGVDETVVTEAVAVELQSQETQDLDDLLIDSSQQDDVEDGLSHLTGVDENVDDVNAPAATNDAFEAGATQHLDNLLGEFSDDDDLSFIGSQDSFDADVIEQGKTAIASSGADAVGMATDYGATQELDSLLAEFADEDDGLSFIDPIDVATTEQKSFTDIGLDHGATQELDSLLGEFIDANDRPDGSDDIDQGATQVLGHLLDEFSDDIDEDDKKD